MADSECRIQRIRKSVLKFNSIPFEDRLSSSGISKNVPENIFCSENVPGVEEEHALLNTRETTAYSLITGMLLVNLKTKIKKLK